MSLAQEEADRLLNQKEKFVSHPEDRGSTSDRELSDDLDALDLNEKRTNRITARYTTRRGQANEDRDEVDDDDDSYDEGGTKMASSTAYHLPTTMFDANTGPKGVIADAMSYERAKKKSFRRTLMSFAAFDYGKSASNNTTGSSTAAAAADGSARGRKQHKRAPSMGSGEKGSSGESEDEEFMRAWREARMQELQNTQQRRVSPSKRRYGTVDTVDANGYLDAIEKVTPSTIVVVCIYDPEVCPFPFSLKSMLDAKRYCVVF